MIRLLCALALTSVLALAAAGCGGDDSSDDGDSGGGGTATTLADGGVIGMSALRFHPDHVQVKVGQEITWRNDESIPHDVVADSGADFKSEVFNKDKTFTFTPTAAGTIAYECTLHPGMTGTIDVVAQ